MKFRAFLAGTVAALGLAMSGTGAHAASCDPGKSGYDLTADEAQAVYDCLKDSLLAGYKKKNKRWIPADRVENYRSWVPASTAPAAPGFHNERFLFTYVNQTGADAYLKYEEDPAIPAGTLIAKESFTVNDAGKAGKGPLFFMEKVEAGKSPETNDWYYYAVAANGTPMGVNVMTACNQCHMENFGHQGGLGYPIEDVRVSN